MLAHAKELEKLMDQVRAKRAELSDLVKTNIRELEPRVAELEEKIVYLKSEVSKLDVTIGDKQIRYETEYNSCTERFNKLEAELRRDFDKKVSALNEDITHYQNLNKEASELTRSAKDQTVELAAATKALIDQSKILENQRKAFKQERIDFVDYKESEAGRIRALEQKIEAGRNKILEDSNKLDIREDILIRRELVHNDILAKEAGFSKREAACAIRENVCTGREEELDQLKVSLLAQRQKNIETAEANQVLLNELNVREHNIKTSEKLIAERV